MITYDKYKSKENFSNINKQVLNVKENIDNIRFFSNILDVVSITRLEETTEDSTNSLYIIKDYELYTTTNSYNDLKCPLCKKKDCLNHYKEYKRNITLYINSYKIEALITITVLECNHCRKSKVKKQHYHALLPVCIFPYHIYSSNSVIKTIYEKEILNLKIEDIVERRKISHQLLYKWLKGFKQYLLSSYSILETNTLTDTVIEIQEALYWFISNFYQTYHHPFFLFRTTCVPLVITL